MPTVSVIMNCRNCARYLGQALDSVSQQTFKDYDIVFWDNLSDDGSGEIAQGYGEPLRYFRGEKYLPLGAARNAALENAGGKYIAFLDCDDVWLPEKLEKQVALLNSNEPLGLVYADSYIIDANGDLKEGTYFIGRNPARGQAFHNLLQGNPIPLLTAVIRRSVLEKTGMFNPKYEIAEEYDLWLRIAADYPIDFIEQPLAKFRVHSDSTTLNNAGLSYQEEIEIVDYWLKIKPELKRELGDKIRRRKSSLRRAWLVRVLGQVYHNRNGKSLREFVGFIKYLLS